MTLSLRAAALFALCLTLPACSSYKVLINQGNVVQAEKLAQLEPGMTPVQVEYLLGTPLLRSAIAPDRWDYVLQVRRDGQNLQERRVTVYFEEGHVARIEDTNAAEAEAEAS